MPWTINNPPPPAKNWPKADRRKCVDAANAALRNGKSEQEAIYACINAAGRSQSLDVRGTGVEWMDKPGQTRFQEAIRASRERGIALPDTYYGQLQGAARSRAFSVAGMSQLGQIRQVLDSLTESMEAGDTFQAWRRRVSAGEVPLNLPRHRLENIWRTNLQNAYAMGRCEHIERNKERRPYLLYSAINDSRTRPSHAAMDGHVAAVDDPIWHTWTPPNGFQCRCSAISLSQQQAERYGARDNSEPADAAPDQGWNYSPCQEPDPEAEDPLSEYETSLPAPLKERAARLRQGAHQARSLDPETWTEAEGQAPGQLFEAPDGSRYSLSQYDDPQQGRVSVAALGVSRRLGLDAPDARPVERGGTPGVAAPWPEDRTPMDPEDLKLPEYREEVAKVYQSAVLTKNTGILENGGDIYRGEDGRLVLGSAAGAMSYAASGATKPYEVQSVAELEAFFDSAQYPGLADVFNAHGRAAMQSGFRNRLEGLSKEEVRAAFHDSGMDLERARVLTDATWQRRNELLRQLR